MMKTVAVIVTYNRKAKLIACMKAIVAQVASCEILVVDNDSTDGTKDAIFSVMMDITTATYINTGANLGGAGGFAFGIREAVRRGADRIWIMDDDVLPEPDALEKLLAADAELNGDYGWLSSRCVGLDGNVCPMNLQRATPFRKVNGERICGDRRILVQMASFVSLFFSTETVARYGLPIADFFIWCDDLEWTRYVSRRRPCYVVPSSIVVHDIAGTAASDLATDIQERINRYFYAFRNEFFTYRREGIIGLAYYFSKCLKHLLRVLLFARDHRGERLSALAHGMLSGFTFNPKRQYVRDALG